MNTYVPQNMEWTISDKLVTTTGFPDALKGRPTFRLYQKFEVPTTWNPFEMNLYVPQNMEWTIPDKLVAAMGVPDAVKGHPTFRLDQTLEVPHETN